MASFRCPLWFHVLFSAIMFLVGVPGFFAFVFSIGNINAGIWCLTAGLYALVVLHLHLLFHYQKVEKYHSINSLKFLMFLGALGALAAAVASITYVMLILIQHIPLEPLEKSILLGSIQGFLAFKWGLSLTIFARKYKRVFYEGYYIY